MRILGLSKQSNIAMVQVFNMMMAKENASMRREWMEAYGNLVDADIS